MSDGWTRPARRLGAAWSGCEAGDAVSRCPLFNLKQNETKETYLFFTIFFLKSKVFLANQGGVALRRRVPPLGLCHGPQYSC